MAMGMKSPSIFKPKPMVAASGKWGRKRSTVSQPKVQRGWRPIKTGWSTTK